MKTASLSLILLLVACNSASLNPGINTESEADLPPTDLNRVVEGVSAPDFTLQSSDNERITLSSYRDKKNVILVFYRGYW